MDEKLTALVRGANKGLGKEIVRQLAKRAMRVYLCSRDRARGEAAALELIAEDLDVIPVELDVTKDDSVTALAGELQLKQGRLDILVNNAGILVSRPAFEITSAEMRDTYDTNVFGVVRMIHAMLPLLQAASQPRIVNIASTTASLTLANDPTTMFGREDTIVAMLRRKHPIKFSVFKPEPIYNETPIISGHGWRIICCRCLPTGSGQLEHEWQRISLARRCSGADWRFAHD
jgi:NAD(P)-dependent dehydrogenase (short-subunit alcohol dehydrogenase family)